MVACGDTWFPAFLHLIYFQSSPPPFIIYKLAIKLQGWNHTEMAQLPTAEAAPATRVRHLQEEGLSSQRSKSLQYIVQQQG